jgi:phospholipid transport system substrate-binding protein
MITRRHVLRYSLAGTALAMTLSSARFALAAEPQPGQVVHGFYDTLLATMKEGQRLGFAGRRDRLAPAVKKAFDLPRMTRLAVGLRWQGLTSQQQADLISAFTDYSIATYASRFTDYAGERFEVDPNPTASDRDLIVHTKLIRKTGDPVQLDYLMTSDGSVWRIVDVYLSGTISELATRRSEFSAVLNRGGAEALVEALRKKATEQQS